MTFFERLASEWAYLTGTVRLFWRLGPTLLNKTRTFGDEIADLAGRHADRPALIDPERTITYRELDEGANRIARWARSQGVTKGDVVGLLMPNRAEYLMTWLGVSRTGAVTALLNTQQVGHQLAHSIDLVKPVHLIVDRELAGNLGEAFPQVREPTQVWLTNAGGPAGIEGSADFDAAVDTMSPAPLADSERPALTTADPCLYIYTSGTTGLPKAAVITHYRVRAGANGFSAAVHPGPEDRIYVPLPLYHTTGGILGLGAALTVGGAAIVRRRFSASEFWRDCVRYQATRFFYIGELCRYLLNAPECPEEKQHTVRAMCGNGLRPDIWRPFQERFGIPEIKEFYAATEGNVVLINQDGREGALGRIPAWARSLFVVDLVVFDWDTETAARGPDGRCIRAKVGEPGEAVGRIEIAASKPAARFDGYADTSETERKILRDVFAEGDMWFRTGDLMRKDEIGNFYFVDRIGDTFRWKGENVSTAEVAEAVGSYDGIGEANVYGVEVPGHNGRAGMAMIVADHERIDFAGLAAHLDHSLARYARPRFLRVVEDTPKTTTFKQQKRHLVEEGFDPAQVPDRLYYLDLEAETYRPLDAGVYAKIACGEIPV